MLLLLDRLGPVASGKQWSSTRQGSRDAGLTRRGRGPRGPLLLDFLGPLGLELQVCLVPASRFFKQRPFTRWAFKPERLLLLADGHVPRLALPRRQYFCVGHDLCPLLCPLGLELGSGLFARAWRSWGRRRLPARRWIGNSNVCERTRSSVKTVPRGLGACHADCDPCVCLPPSIHNQAKSATQAHWFQTRSRKLTLQTSRLCSAVPCRRHWPCLSRQACPSSGMWGV